MAKQTPPMSNDKSPKAKTSGQGPAAGRPTSQARAGTETTTQTSHRATGAQSAQLSRGQQRRQAMRKQRRPWWRGPIPLIGTVVVVLVAIIVFIVIANATSSGANAAIGQPVSASFLQQVTGVSSSTIATVGAGTLANGSPLPLPLHAVTSTALSAHGKPQFLYIGGEFCPYCGSDRWSIVNALSRFGTFSNLHYMRSADTDGDIATFTFKGSSYSSPYIDFAPYEHEDRNRQILQTLSDQQLQLLQNLGGNGYPFVDIAGKYANDAPNSYPGGYDAGLLVGKNWSQIANALSNPKDPITQGMIGNANDLTAAICLVTHNQPANVCTIPTIQSIETKLSPKH